MAGAAAPARGASAHGSQALGAFTFRVRVRVRVRDRLRFRVRVRVRVPPERGGRARGRRALPPSPAAAA